jgi:hypothetical protein
MQLDRSYIYGLTDPGNGQVRYIGQSVHPEVRFLQHIRYSRGALGLWIRELALWDMRPDLIIFGQFDLDTIVEQESRFLEKYQGNDLLNRRPASRAHYYDSYSNHEIECVETGQRFPSYAAAARAYQCSLQTIKNHCIDGGTTSNQHFRRIQL